MKSQGVPVSVEPTLVPLIRPASQILITICTRDLLLFPFPVTRTSDADGFPSHQQAYTCFGSSVVDTRIGVEQFYHWSHLSPSAISFPPNYNNNSIIQYNWRNPSYTHSLQWPTHGNWGVYPTVNSPTHGWDNNNVGPLSLALTVNTKRIWLFCTNTTPPGMLILDFRHWDRLPNAQTVVPHTSDTK